MKIEAIDILAAQRAALLAPAEESEAIYQEQVMEPWRSMWVPMLARMSQGGGNGEAASLINAARMFGFYLPEHGVEQGLAALDVLERAGTWEACQRALEIAADALKPEEHGIPLEQVQLSVVLMNPEMALQNEKAQGYSGFGSMPGYVMVTVWPNDYNVPRLPSAAAHEFNHNVRLSYEPWSQETSVGQYVVLEGLAESFAGELFGSDKVGPWTQLPTEADMELARTRIREGLEVTGFNEIRGYIFGDWAAAAMGYTPQGLPDFAGYSIGYHIVQAYMQCTGSTAAEATYLPWREIVEESRYL
ncbi:MAG TPA: DUF2268 domain-containing putative Zn-dependent protease [Chloroflexia bacterium]|nr:DUF2268 domain-containing putative Zn-dependent protease [Chloroflexia bacterium]